MDEKNWRKRFKYRVDLSSRVTHLTKGETAEEAFRNLINILEERRIRGSKTSSGFICGETPAVCLQEAPLTAIADTINALKKYSFIKKFTLLTLEKYDNMRSGNYR